MNICRMAGHGYIKLCNHFDSLGIADGMGGHAENWKITKNDQKRGEGARRIAEKLIQTEVKLEAA